MVKKNIKDIVVDFLYTARPKELYEWVFENHDYNDVDLDFMLNQNPRCYTYMPKRLREKWLNCFSEMPRGNWTNFGWADIMVGLLKRDDFDGKELAQMMIAFGEYAHIFTTIKAIVNSGKNVPFFLEKMWVHEMLKPGSRYSFAWPEFWDRPESEDIVYKKTFGAPMSSKGLAYLQMIKTVEM